MNAGITARTALLLSFALAPGCAREPNIEIRAGIDECHECHMVIDQANQAGGYVLDGEFLTFDSPGCLLRSFESLPKERRPQPADIYFADYRDASLFSAETAAFLLTSHIPTVMNARVLSFGERKAAEDAHEHFDEMVTNWVGYRTVRGTPDVTVELVVGPDGMEPEIVEVAKDDLILLRLVGRGLSRDVSISITGYPEAGTVTVTVDGSVAEVRILVSRPGAGFPVVANGENALGMMKVSGSHTVDEEAG